VVGQLPRVVVVRRLAGVAAQVVGQLPVKGPGVHQGLGQAQCLQTKTRKLS